MPRKEMLSLVLLMASMAKALPARTLSTIYSFCSQGGGCPDGEYPNAGLVQGVHGDLYGTTSGGGANRGTIFKITPAGALTTVYTFCSQPNCTDGAAPFA